MSDVLIRGGSVVDGTGAAPRPADVRVRGGRVVEVAERLAADGEEVFDAGGAYVTPGFIDTHAHVDPQVFWDPALDPEPQHGVTTLLVGNCSLTLYPVSDATRGELADLFAYIEDVPRRLFDECVPWTWSDYAGYRDSVNAAGTGANLAALVGHSAIRIAVMGDDAWTRVATAIERDQMAALLRAQLAAGAWGLSTSHLDVDAKGRSVPSRAADDAEVDALLDTVGSFRRGLVEIVPDLLSPIPQFDIMEDLARRCGQRNLPLTWTGFAASERKGFTDVWVALAQKLRSEGVPFYPQMSPRTIDFRLNWDSSMMFMSMPQGWHRVIAAVGDDAKAALLTDPLWRQAARDEWDRTKLAMFPHRRPERVRFVEVQGRENECWLGQSLADLVAARGGHPSDVLADFVLANGCRPGVVAHGISNADVDQVARILTDPAFLVSSSDAGAHLQMLCASGDTTLVLTRHVRERGDFTIERAVYEMTGRQAEVFGFTNRGRVAPGCHADLAVFDLDELHYDTDVFVSDLPGGGKLTGALPGRVIGAGDS